jgi:hypothetical protein
MSIVVTQKFVSPIAYTTVPILNPLYSQRYTVPSDYVQFGRVLRALQSNTLALKTSRTSAAGYRTTYR